VILPMMEALSLEEIKTIDRQSRDVLRNIGVNVHNREALELFRRGGAIVDEKTMRVKIPDALFNATLAKCSPSIRLYARDGHPPLFLGGRKSYYGTGGIATQCLDGETMQYRPVVTQDLIHMAKLYDVLERPHFGITSATPTDIPTEVSDLVEFKIMATHTRKHILVQAKNKRHLEKIIRMAEVVSGMSREDIRRRPWFSLLICITSPLFIRNELAELLMAGAAAGVPMLIEAGPMAGATGPATLAHALIHTNAENFAAIILAKLVNPDIPFIYASWARCFDMKYATVCHGGPEFPVLRIGTTQMAKYYNLPSGGGGMLTDSKFLDSQYGIEKLGTTLLPAMAGCNIILGMGLTADQDALSLEALVIDEEITRWVDRALEGIRVNETTTDLGITEKIGPEGAFLEDPHTLKNYRSEMWIPLLCNRQPATHGADISTRTILHRTQRQIEKLMASWQGPKIPKDAGKEMDQIIQSKS
jgi:trimethylamine---corrinoid protein Co-methyltransferase